MKNLVESGKFDVTGLEGRDRVGGRTFTDENGNEIGAAWIHGIERNIDETMIEINPVYEMAKEFIDDEDLHATMNFFAIQSDGSELGSVSTIWQSMWLVLNKIKTSTEAVEHAYKPTLISVYEFISKNWTKLFNDVEGENEKAIVKSVIEWQSYFATNWETTAIGSMAVDREFEGDQLLIGKGGYSRILNRYLQNHQLADRIHLNAIVNRIERSPDGPCKVSTQDGREYFADIVVVTVPLGVLKRGSITFVPPLPDPKLDAIRRLGFGVYDKIFVTFSEAIEAPNGFWNPGADVISVVPKDDDDHNEYLRVAKSHLLALNNSSALPRRPYYERDPEHIGIEIANLSNISGIPKIVMLIYGEAAIHLESIADSPEELKAFVLAKLTNAFPKCFIPEITSVKATKWGQDQFSYGSFANIPVGSSGHDMIVLSEPVEDKILFAGEATFPLHYSTVHGAMKSGRREFARIIRKFFPFEENIYENLLET